jgi:hypothetical protein
MLVRSLRGRVTLSIAAAFLLNAAALSSSMPLPSTGATSSITARDLKRHLSFLASEELGGRYTLSKSNLIAARYLASQLEFFGYRGAGPGGSFFQPVPLSVSKIDTAASRLTLTVGGAKREFKYTDGFVSEGGASIKASGPLVFVGHGISSPENGWDDFAEVDVKGKIIVAVARRPEKLKAANIPEAEREEGAALSHGAEAEILVPGSDLLSGWRQIKDSFQHERIGLPPKGSVTGFTSRVYAGPDLVNALAAAMGKEASYLKQYQGQPGQAPSISASASIAVAVDVKQTPPAQNVAGILEGSDPKLKDEYVVFSAHYDHLETGANGKVYKGADDDGSGTASVLEIAQAFTVGERPKRSILIIFHTGEELGLFGSEYNTDYKPVVPLQKLVADFNIDMVGRSKPAGDDDPRDARLTDKNSIYIIGADKLSTELNQISEQTDADTERMHFDYTYNDDSNPERFYYRSDHYNYARHGIPIIFYFTGVHRDYHQPTDTVDKIDFQKMERIDRLVFATGWRVANLDHRLVVDKKPAPDPGEQ